MLRVRTFTSLTLLTLAPLSVAQGTLEGFEGGSNEGNFEVWFNAYNANPMSGGNPGAYLELDTVTPPVSNCHFVEIFQTTWPNAFSGDYRTRGITSIGLDVDAQAGAYGGQWTVTLWSDPGTPFDTSDDCGVEHVTTSPPPPLNPGWMSFDFPVQSQSMTMPLSWTIVGACVGTQPDTVWNQVMQDVDYVEFVMNSDPLVFCAFTSWLLGVDNVRLFGSIAPGPFCISTPNSTGLPALMEATGSASVAANSLTLTASPLPPNQTGLFYYGGAQVAFTFGNGVRCVSSGGVGTYRFPIQSTGAGGVLSMTPDLTMPPQASGLVTPGSTWYYQAWYRDPFAGGAFFDLSDGYGVTFLP